MTALLDLVSRHPNLFRGEAPEGHLPPGWFSIADELLAGMERILGTDAQHVRIVGVHDEFGTLSVPYTFDPDNPPDNNAVLELRHRAETVKQDMPHVRQARHQSAL